MFRLAPESTPPKDAYKYVQDKTAWLAANDFRNKYYLNNNICT